MGPFKYPLGKRIVLGLLLLVPLGLWTVFKDLPPLALSNPAPNSIEVFDRQGQSIGILGAGPHCRLAAVPPILVQALLVAEDRDFFQHQGVSWRGLLRALSANLSAGSYVQGGSTITMQTVRLLTEARTPTLRRKLREIALAHRLEDQLSKEEILTYYLNHTYFGEGQYGLAAASTHYFGRPPITLGPFEAATLVAMLKAPNSYCRRQPERLKKRRDLILALLHQQGQLQQVTLQQTLETPLGFAPLGPQDQAAFFLDQVRTQLKKHLGPQYRTLCAQVHTTLDLNAQGAALKAFSTVLPQVDQHLDLPPYHTAPFIAKQDYPQVAFVALDLDDGSVLAWLGGRDYAAAPFNAQGGRVLAHRPPGSAFKTFAYALAMSRGLRPDTVIEDGPITLLDANNRFWSPDNYNSRYMGPTILKLMLVNSLNSMAVRLVNQHLGPEDLAQFAHSCGIGTRLPPHPSLALGPNGLTPLELARAYAVFARQGFPLAPPHILQRVLDPQGKTLLEHQPAAPPAPVLDSASSFLTIDALKAVVEQGTGRRINTLLGPAETAGKSGTSTDHRDAWFIGLTPKVVCAAWVGFDDNRPMETPQAVITGGNSAAALVGHFWQGYPAALDDHFWQPAADALVWYRVDPHTGESDASSGVQIPYVLHTLLEVPDSWEQP